MKVHVTLRDGVRHDPTAKQHAYKKLVQDFGLHDVNEKRFERYGIITAELDDDQKMEDLKRLEEVGSVERDSEKRAI